LVGYTRRVARGLGIGEGRRGVFITFEGPEGSGKTTQAARLAEALGSAGLPVVLTREPGGTEIGERIRTILLAGDHDQSAIDPRADALLFNAARAQLVADVISPALERGSVVICARYADSTVAYQGAGRGIAIAELRELEAFATIGLKPDLTILLDLPVQVGLRRKEGAEQTRFETGYDLAFHERVRAGFLGLAEREPERFAVVDAGRSPDEVFAAVSAAVARLPRLGALGADAGASGQSGPRAMSDHVSGEGPDRRPGVDEQRVSDLERPAERMYA
jgi:dTMP kinase